MAASIPSLLRSCRRNNFKQTNKLNENMELQRLNFSENKTQTSVSEVTWKNIWTFDEIHDALLNSLFYIIPTEIILKIFQLLSNNDRKNLSLVCRYFKMIIDQINLSKTKYNLLKKFNLKSYKQIYTDWINEKYFRKKKIEEKYQYIKIPSGIKSQHSFPSINNELFSSIFGLNQHPNSSRNMTIQLSVDLDKTAHELISLLEKTSKFKNKWRKSVILQEMIQRYYRFMILKSLYPKLFLIPTIDIEIVWQTHLLRPFIYQNDCLRLFNKIIDHSLLLNHIQQSFKQQAFLHTYYLYEKHFNEQYAPLLLYKNKKISLTKYIYPYFNKLQCLTPIYSYWDETLVQFSQCSGNNYENPFSFDENEIILNINWIDLCKQFMNEMFFDIPRDIWSFNFLNPINLKPLAMKQLKKSYEKFLYIIKKYSLIKQNHLIQPTYAIDIIWYSHMQEPLKYANDCYRLFGYFIDHYPRLSIDKYQIKKSYKELQQYWKKEFQNDISIDHLPKS